MTRSISQDTQNDLRVLVETYLSYEGIVNRLTLSKATIHRYCKKWNIQRPDNSGGRPQILTEASKSLMKRMVILERLKPGVEAFDYFKAIYPRFTYNTTLNALKSLIQNPTKKKGTSFVSKTQ
jgi:transposase